MRSCERPRKRSASEALPSSVSNRYSLSIRTHGSSCRRRASSSLRRVSSFSAFSSSSRALSHSSRVPVLCFAIALLPFLCALLPQVGVGLFQAVMRQHHLVAGDQPARQLVVQDLALHVIPAIPRRLGAHGDLHDEGERQRYGLPGAASKPSYRQTGAASGSDCFAGGNGFAPPT